MAFAVTQRSSVNSGTTSVGSQATASFTPAANSRLFVFAAGQRDDHVTARSWTISDTLGLTWTKLNESTLYQWDGFARYETNVVCWYTDIGASPASMTVTVDASGGNEFYGVIAFDVTGYDTGTPFAQTSAANGASVDPASNSASGTLTLGSAPTNGNLVVAMFGAGADAGGGFTTPTGYTALTNQSQAYCQASVFYHTSTTTAAVTCSDLGQTVGNWGGIIFEVKLAGAATIAGTASITLGTLTSSGSGALAIAGTGTPTLAALTSSGSGALPIAGTATITLAALTTSGEGTLSIAGTASITLDALTSSGSGALPIAGTAAITLATLTSSGSGALPIAGTAAITLAALTSSGSGALPITGTASITLAALTASGEGVITSGRTGTAAITLAALTTSGEGTLSIAGTASITLDALTSSGSGALPIAGTAAITLAALTSSGSGYLDLVLATIVITLNVSVADVISSEVTAADIISLSVDV